MKNVNANEMRMDSTSRDPKKQEQNILRVKRKDQLNKLGWNNTRAQWKRLPLSFIPSTFE